MWAQNCVQLYIYLHSFIPQVIIGFLKAAAINILYLIVGLKDNRHDCSDKDIEIVRRFGVFQLAVLVLRQLPDFEASHCFHQQCFQGFQGKRSENLLHANSLRFKQQPDTVSR